jgi:hypothetical protein
VNLGVAIKIKNYNPQKKWGKSQRRITGLYTLAPTGRGFRLARSFAYGSFPRQPTPTFFCARETATRFPSSGAKKRRIQPERYVQYGLKWLNILYKTWLTKCMDI